MLDILNLNPSSIPTPCYIVDEKLLRKNLEILQYVINKTNCKILLAQKAFSMFSLYPIIAEYLHGTTASGLFEAKLGYEEMGKPFNKETHVFSPAYTDKEFDEIISICDHIVFNSFEQWLKYKNKIFSSSKKIECGIRINPQYSEIKTDLYNPCILGSRLGTTLEHFKNQSLDGISGLHFHTMCEQNSDTLSRTLKIVDKNFSEYIKNMKWINFGGGHHITRDNYDIELLINCISSFREKYNVNVYLEPGEAVALNTGYLAATVLDVIKNDINIAVLDASAACHMPDVLEMPYRPDVIGSAQPNVKNYTYRLAGNTCLAGDVIGDYSFDFPLKPGDVIFFCDMAHYSMVKNNTFNGMPLPSIAILSNSKLKLIKSFDYYDFKSRLS